MKSREDETYVALTNCSTYVDVKECELYEIAISLGRIADILAEMNGCSVEYDDPTKNVDRAERKDSSVYE